MNNTLSLIKVKVVWESNSQMMSKKPWSQMIWYP
jgi:hypothetical protein